MEEPGPVGDNGLVADEEAHKEGRAEVVAQRHRSEEGDSQAHGEADAGLHPLPVAGGVVVADDGHDPLGRAEGDIHGHHVDLLGDAHGGHRVRAEAGGEVVEHRHSGHVQQVLDSRRDAHGAHAGDNDLVQPEHAGADAHIGLAPAHEEQHKEVGAGGAVGQEGGQPRPGGPHVEPPGQDEEGVQDDVEQTAAHGTDAGVESSALGADHVGHHHVEDRRSRAPGHGPVEVCAGGGGGAGVRAQQGQQGALGGEHQQGEHQSAAHSAVESKGGGAADGVIVTTAQGPAHHAGGAHAEEVVHRVEGQQHRSRQSHGGILDRVPQHAHEIGVRQIVDDHHQGADDGGHGHGHHGLGDGSLLK